MAIHYVIHVSGGQKLDILAEKMNLGINRLWFYDGDDNLQAVFRWAQIEGFSIEGSATGQVIIDELLHERKLEAKTLETLEQTQGPTVAGLESAIQGLETVKTVMRSAWLKVHDAKSRTTETRLLLEERRNDLLRYRARLEDHRRELESLTTRLADELNSLLKSGS